MDKTFEDGMRGEAAVFNKLFPTKEECRRVQRPDFTYDKDNKSICIEVKNKEYYKAPPFDGHGLNYSQYKKRINTWKEKGTRCLMVVREKDTPQYYLQWLDILGGMENYYLERSKIILFPLKHFIAVDEDDLHERAHKMIDSFIKGLAI